MANWCSNWVTVEGEEQNVQSFKEEMAKLANDTTILGHGVRPSEEGDLWYMFDIQIEDNVISFMSKWDPANDSLQFLAKKHQVTITNQYSETGNMIFGQWFGDGETENNVWLTDEEWDLAVPGDEDGSFYIYDGKEYEVQEDALEEILDKKLQGLL